MNSREFEKRLRHLRKVEQLVQPDSRWVESNRGALLSHIQADAKRQPSASLFRQLRSFVQQFVPTRLLAQIRGPILATLSGLSVILGGSIASVSAAERSIPGDFLYPVKLVTEQTRLVFVSDKTERLKLKTEFVGRRVDEIKEIVKQDVPEKPQRIKEAAAILKRDLDTVKNQLNDVGEAQPVDRAKAAKKVDDAGAVIAVSLKQVKTDAPQEVRADLAEAEAAAVSTSIKAVQVILDSQTDVEAQKVISHEEIVQSISAKVEGVTEQLNSATQQLVNAGGISSSTTLAIVNATSSVPAVGSTSNTALTLPTSGSASTSAQIEIINAHASLAEAKQLLSENKLEEVGTKLAEANKVIVSVEKKAEALSSATSSQPLVNPPVSATGTAPTMATSTSTSSSATTTQGTTTTTAATTTPVNPPTTSGSRTRQ